MCWTAFNLAGSAILTKPHRSEALNSIDKCPISELSPFGGTMDINALVIRGSDPGAVPGVSTKHPSFEDHGDEIGSTNV